MTKSVAVGSPVRALDVVLEAAKSSVAKDGSIDLDALSEKVPGSDAGACAVFDRIIKEHAASPQFLPARLKRAQCLLKQGLKPAALKAFRELVDGFPGSAEARTAQQELSDLGL